VYAEARVVRQVNPYKPSIATAVPQTLEKRLEILAAIRDLAVLDGEQRRNVAWTSPPCDTIWKSSAKRLGG